MKKIYKYLFMLVLGIILIPFLNVNAQTYKDSIIERDEWVAGDYIKKIKGNHIFFQQMTILKRASDRQYVYCIQPGTPIVDGVVYNGYDSDYAVISKMSEEQWNRVSLLAYYGYGYKDENVDHTAKKWYVITQFMIWHSVPTDYEQIYFTDKLNGKKIIKYTAEMAEMEELLSKHYKVPNFNNIQTEMTIGSQTTITDTNGVLGKFNIQSVDKLKVQKNGNNLVIEAAEVGEGQITFSKTNNRFGRIAIVYVDDKSQNILFAGDIDPTRAKLNIKVVGGKVTINKLDKDNNEPKSQGEAISKSTALRINDILDYYGIPPMVLGYGQTEFGTMVMFNNDIEDRTNESGILIPNVKAKIVDLVTGKEVEKGKRGELYIQSPAVMRGYLNNPEANSNFFITDENGEKWAKTGDIAEIKYQQDSKDVYEVSGRSNDSFIDENGNVIYLFDIENKVEDIKYVNQAEVISLTIDGKKVPIVHIVLDKKAKALQEDVVKLIDTTLRTNITNINEIPYAYKVRDNFDTSPISGKRDYAILAYETDGYLKIDEKGDLISIKIISEESKTNNDLVKSKILVRR